MRLRLLAQIAFTAGVVRVVASSIGCVRDTRAPASVCDSKTSTTNGKTIHQRGNTVRAARTDTIENTL